MPSVSFQSFETALKEVQWLLVASPSASGAPPTRPDTARAVGRAGIVLLSSHFERYFYAVNEEAVAAINSWSTRALPEALRLLHSKCAMDTIELTSWENRAQGLAQFVQTDGWLWDDRLEGIIDGDRLLSWMKSPKPRDLVRYYRYWGIEDVFGAVTRTRAKRSEFWRKIQGLVDKRNSIAHGDTGEQATTRDVRGYATAVREFCSRADRVLSRQLSRLCKEPRPW